MYAVRTHIYPVFINSIIWQHKHKYVQLTRCLCWSRRKAEQKASRIKTASSMGRWAHSWEGVKLAIICPSSTKNLSIEWYTQHSTWQHSYPLCFLRGITRVGSTVNCSTGWSTIKCLINSKTKLPVYLLNSDSQFMLLQQTCIEIIMTTQCSRLEFLSARTNCPDNTKLVWTYLYFGWTQVSYKAITH